MSVSSRLDSSSSPQSSSSSSSSSSSAPSSEQGILFVHLARARKLLQQGKYDVARQELELALLARPDDEDVLNLLSVAEFKRGNYHEAGRAARALLRDNPGSAILHANLGLIQFKAGVLGEAEQELRRAIELQPDHARSHLHLGLLYRMRGKLGLALEHLRFAGAKRVVAEIEEALRKQTREPATRAATRPAAVTTAPQAAGLAPHAADTAPQAANTAPRATVLAPQGADPAPKPAPTPPEARETALATPPPPAPPVGEPAAPPALRLAPPTAAPAPESATPARPAMAPRPLVSTAPATPGTEFLGEPQGTEPERGIVLPAAAPVPLPAPSAAEASDALPDEAWEAIEAPFPEADLPAPVLDAPPDRAPAPAPRVPEMEASPLFLVRPDGGLEIASRDVVFVRRGSVVWYSGKMRFAPEASFRGTRLEKILRADGRGHLFVNDPGRQAFKRDLAGQSLFVEGSRVLALDHGLSFRLEPIHDFRMNRRVDVLKIHGTGSVVLSVGGALLAHEVSPEFPLSVSSRDLVAWTGDLVPSVLEDRFLEEVMMPDVGSAPKIRFEGTGTVLTEPPRPRRRASDLSRGGGEKDRRTS